MLQVFGIEVVELQDKLKGSYILINALDKQDMLTWYVIIMFSVQHPPPPPHPITKYIAMIYMLAHTNTKVLDMKYTHTFILQLV